jgi:peptidoglycan/LPS O-acetylase OafA/YrhL
MSTARVLPVVSEAPRFYRPELDCLRFFAFFAVFVFHTFPPDAHYYSSRHVPFSWLAASISRAGSFGVDLFFLLSAYLITELLLREKQQSGAVHLQSFYIRRILRIWPLYFLAILIGALLPLFDAEQHFPPKYIAGFLLLYGNWLTSLIGLPGSVMNLLWSVSFEEQFYLLWPAIISKSQRMQTLLITSGVLLLTAQCGRLILLKYARHGEAAIFTNTVARLDPLAIGILTALLMRNRIFDLDRPRRLACLAAGATVWIAAGHYFAMSELFMLIGYPAMALGAWLIFMSILDSGLAPRWITYLGKISYGLYVFHLLCLYLAEKLLSPHRFSTFFVYWWLGLAMTIALASISYAFFESPFLRLKERFVYVKSRPI